MNKAANQISLSNFMPERLGTVDPANFPDETFELYSIPAYDNRCAAITDSVDIGSAKQIVQPGDVLLSKIVPHIRRSWIVGPVGQHRQIASSEWIVFRSHKIEPHYLRQIFLSDRFHEQFMATVAGVGGSLLRARPKEVGRILIPLPSLEEQRRIASILDAAEALSTKRHAAIAKLHTLAQSIFREMFGNPVANERGWEQSTVSDFVAGFESGKNLVALDEDDRESEFRVLKVSALTSLEYRPEESKPLPRGYTPPSRHFVRAGDLLFSRANTSDLIGATAFVYVTPTNIVLPDKIWRFVWHEEPRADPHFVWFLFRHPAFRYEIAKRATGTSGSMKNISQEKVFGIRVGLPPIHLQRQFASEVMLVHITKERAQISMAKLDGLFTTLQYHAFQGEL